jgi:zinc transport system substrate-binding protein
MICNSITKPSALRLFFYFNYHITGNFMKCPVLPVIMLVLLFAGCAQKDAASAASLASTADDGITVVCTIFPPYDFTRTIAAGVQGVNIQMLLPPASESHSYEPTPRDIITLQKAALFVYTGGESDAWIARILGSLDSARTGEALRVVKMLDCVDAVEEEIVEGMEAGDEDTEDAEYDEHVWTSPRNAIRIARAITDALCAVDAKNAARYLQNMADYQAQLEDLDAAFREVTLGAARKTLVFGDRFPFRYFADEYGLDYFAAFPGCSSEMEPSAATVAFLIDKVKAEGIPVVFYLELSNRKMADTIAEATGASTRLLHSAHNVTRDEFRNGVTYLEVMRQNVDALKEALRS